MQSTMIRIEMNAKMEKAVARCKANHPKVRRTDAQTVKVFGNGGAYTVRFAEPRTGLKLACCDCKAGLSGQLCYHIPAALACPAPIVTIPVIPKTAPKLPTLPVQSTCARATSLHTSQTKPTTEKPMKTKTNAAPVTAVDSFDADGQFQILALLRDIKRIASNEDAVDTETGDKLWRLADAAAQIIEQRPMAEMSHGWQAGFATALQSPAPALPM